MEGSEGGVSIFCSEDFGDFWDISRRESASFHRFIDGLLGGYHFFIQGGRGVVWGKGYAPEREATVPVKWTSAGI